MCFTKLKFIQELIQVAIHAYRFFFFFKFWSREALPRGRQICALTFRVDIYHHLGNVFYIELCEVHRLKDTFFQFQVFP